MTDMSTTTWQVRLALQLWSQGQMTWTELQAVVTESGLTEQEVLTLSSELGV